MMELKTLLDLINQKREQMIRIGMNEGLTSTACINVSEEIDKLVNQYQRLLI
jgi:Spo0E like sporulation regulatory protein